jgi:hypothetical protein
MKKAKSQVHPESRKGPKSPSVPPYPMVPLKPIGTPEEV